MSVKLRRADSGPMVLPLIRSPPNLFFHAAEPARLESLTLESARLRNNFRSGISGPQGRLRKRWKWLTPMQISGRDMRRRYALKVPRGRQTLSGDHGRHNQALHRHLVLPAARRPSIERSRTLALWLDNLRADFACRHIALSCASPQETCMTFDCSDIRVEHSGEAHAHSTKQSVRSASIHSCDRPTWKAVRRT